MIEQGHFHKMKRRAPYKDEVEAAHKAQKREPSDPYIFQRAMALMASGIYMPSDFNQPIGI